MANFKNAQIKNRKEEKIITPAVIKPYCEENIRMSKKQYVESQKLKKEANEAAEKARQAVLAKADIKQEPETIAPVAEVKEEPKRGRPKKIE